MKLDTNNDEKKRQLYMNQKQLLETFLEHGAISKAQFDKSLGDLTEKIGMQDEQRVDIEEIGNTNYFLRID